MTLTVKKLNWSIAFLCHIHVNIFTFFLKSVDVNKIIHKKYRENGKLLEYIQQQYIICLSGDKNSNRYVSIIIW